MMKELEDSQAEVQRMLASHKIEADHLGGMKESIRTEVRL
jgi:hypothetical protein